MADGGSTKSDWKIISENEEAIEYTAKGFNPVMHSVDMIEASLKETFEQSPREQIQKVYYYGAGCSEPQQLEIVRKAMVRIFPRAEIYVHSDLMAAARATCEDQKGIVCILGTGSNSCVFDGSAIVDKVPTLGYLLGDEGSGVYLGKLIIQSYFYRDMPEPLAKKLREEFDMARGSVFEQVYHGQRPNYYLAQYSKFAFKYQKDPHIKNLVRRTFSDFLHCHIFKYKKWLHLPIHTVGSIGYFFHDIWSECLNNNGLKQGKWLQKPIDSLAQYHLKIWKSELYG